MQYNEGRNMGIYKFSVQSNEWFWNNYQMFLKQPSNDFETEAWIKSMKQLPIWKEDIMPFSLPYCTSWWILTHVISFKLLKNICSKVITHPGELCLYRITFQGRLCQTTPEIDNITKCKMPENDYFPGWLCLIVITFP